MTDFNWLAAIFFFLAVNCFIVSSLLNWQQIAEVNRKLPDEEQISYWGFRTFKQIKIRQEYKRLYPSGKLLLLSNVFQWAGFGFFLLTVINSGFFD